MKNVADFVKGFTVGKTIMLSLILLVVLTGCAFDKYTLVQIRGEDVKAPIGSVTPFEGKGIKGFLLRRVFWTNEKGRQPAPIDNIKINEENDSKGSLDIIK